MRSLYIILLIINSSFIANAQYTLEKTKYLKYVSIDKLYSAEKNEYLNKDYLTRADSIKSLLFGDLFWFVYVNKRIENELFGKLLAYNERENKITCISDSLFGMYSVRSTTDGLDIFCDNLILIKPVFDINKEEDVGRLKIIQTNINTLKIQKEILLEENSWFSSIYERDDTLYVEVQPMETEFNIYHFFLFWLPRGTPAKYNFIENGDKIRYSFDKEFNIIKKESVK